MMSNDFDILFDLNLPIDPQLAKHDIFNRNVSNLLAFDECFTPNGTALFIHFSNNDADISITINLHDDFFAKAIVKDQTGIVLDAEFIGFTLIRFYQNKVYFYINKDDLAMNADSGWIDHNSMEYHLSYFFLKPKLYADSLRQ
ncbi:hypothetical protein [Bartonella sp. HY038]|uniref:hypothetical protein n=1 Tax=Bartonella sp. HY038 TaxID=2759660 RepID=UPI0015FCF754|nr:hypothetical protein [Bartonella sp. HY038]